MAGIILLYLLKLRRHDFVVSSVFLWEQALQDLQANAPLQKLRRNLLLFMQLLIALLLIAALSRPALQWAARGGQRVMVILDASASMQCTDVTPSRFVAARNEAHKAVEALGPRDEMLIIAAGCSTRTASLFTADKRALHSALDRVQVTDGPADMGAALELVSGLVRSEKGGAGRRLVVISDGALPPLRLPDGMHTIPVHFVNVGKRGDNVGITVMSIRRRVGRTGGFEGLIGIKNFSGQARTFTLELKVNGSLRDAREVVLEAGKQRTDVLTDLPDAGGLLTAHLDANDDLAVDNTANLIIPKVEPVPVVLVTTGNFFLETVLALDPTLKVTSRTTAPASVAPGTVVVVDHVATARLPAGASALLLGSVGACAPDTVVHGGVEPAIADWNRRHPALLGVSFGDVSISKGDVLRPADGAETLIEGTDGALAVVRDFHTRRLLHLGWDLRRSDFPLRVGFPVFMGNALDWLSGQRERAAVLNTRTGQTLTLPAPLKVKEIDVTLPDRSTLRVPVSGTTVALDRLSRAGVYHLTTAGMPPQVAVNLLDTRESNTAPKGKLELEGSGGSVSVKAGAARTEQELWRPLLLLALTLLCAEWWIFHRRIG
jgi:hypothetical protein